MIREIGSEFNIIYEINKKGNKGPTSIQTANFDYIYTRSGREAIGFVLDEIGQNTKVAVLPSYICKSMLKPFLIRGYSIEYFGIDEYFNPNISEVEAALHKNPDIILVVDWFGMNKNQEVISLARKHSEKLAVLLDCTHSYFNNYFNGFINVNADFIIASLRKWFALPDGAVAINCKTKFENSLEFIDNCFFNKRKKAMFIKTEYLNSGDKKLKAQYRQLLSEAEHVLDCEDRIVGISSFSLSLINRMDFYSMKIKLQENFNALYKLIREMENYVIPIVNKFMTDSDCPFSFPIIVNNNRDELQLWLANNGIYCPVLWPLPENIYLNHKVSAYLSDRILSIPCDQRYSIFDMEYIAKMIWAFFGRN